MPESKMPEGKMLKCRRQNAPITVEGGEDTTVIGVVQTVEGEEDLILGGELDEIVIKLVLVLVLVLVLSLVIVVVLVLVLVEGGKGQVESDGGNAEKVEVQSVEGGNGNEDDSDSWISVDESSITESSGGQKLADQTKSNKVKNTCKKKKKQQKKKKITESELDEIIGLEDIQKAKGQKKFLQQSLPALVVGRKANEEVRCFFDGKLRKTFILQSLSRSLNLRVVGEEIVEIGTKKPKKVVCPRVSLRINNLKRSDLYVEIEAFEVPNIMRDILSLKDDKTISVVVGCNYYYKIFTGRTEVVDSDRIGVQTILGWVVDEDPNIPNRVMAHLLKLM